MPAYIDQSFEQFHNHVHIGNLPNDVNAKKITEIFGKFGIIIKLYLKRRISRDATVLLQNPFVILIYERQESVDKIMSERPYFMNDYQLFVRRCLPITRRYPYEAYLTTNKMLIRIPRENHNEILPNDNIIIDYLKIAGGEILRLERFEEKTVLIEFDDYDTVDKCCLLRPHCIGKQMIEIEKCGDEQQARRRAQLRQKSRSVSLKPSSSSPPSSSTIVSTDNQFDNNNNSSVSTPTLNINEQTTQLQLTYRDRTKRLETEHEQIISSLKNQWEQIAKERIRLQRLTLDYQEEQKRFIEENQRLKQLYNENLEDNIRTQNEGERILYGVNKKYSIVKKIYDQLIQNNH